MTQVNVLEAKNELSKLIRLLENGEEDYIVIARNGVPVAQLVLYESSSQRSRIGTAKGKIYCPEDIHLYDDEVQEMFGGAL